MIRGVWWEDGKARYQNRYVLTKGLAAEIRAGRALWGGVITPAVPPRALVEPDVEAGGYKVLPDINIVRHAHRFLALGEGVPPYEVTAELATVGSYDFGGALPLGICAHQKIDPGTGEMIAFRYGLEAPYLVLGGDPGRWNCDACSRYHRRGRSRLYDPRFPDH